MTHVILTFFQQNRRLQVSSRTNTVSRARKRTFAAMPGIAAELTYTLVTNETARRPCDSVLDRRLMLACGSIVRPDSARR
jgi:hypothetical protein